MRLAVIMPVYNEHRTLRTAVERVLAVPLDMELNLVDDGSSDGSREILSELQNQYHKLRVLLQPGNKGKGAALRRGHPEATGDFVVIQDADRSTTPPSIQNLLDPLIQEKQTWFTAHASWAADHTGSLLLHSLGNRLLTQLSNCLTNINLSDMETVTRMSVGRSFSRFPSRRTALALSQKSRSRWPTTTAGL